jgi:hypothetical protein
VFLNQPNLPGSIPFLQSFFAPDRVFGIIELFEIQQPADLIFLRKAFHLFQAMLSYAPNEIVGNADVERAADAIGKNVYLEAACPHSTASGILGRPVKPGDDTFFSREIGVR